MDNLSKEQEIILVLFKEFLASYNSRSLSKVIGISPAGAFKIMVKLKKRGIVNPKTIGKAVIYSLNFENPVTLREIEMALTLEAQNHQKWVEEFGLLKDQAKFVVLFGSILRNEKEAKDIDLLAVADKEKFNDIKDMLNHKNKILAKKAHLILQTPKDFQQDILGKNKAMINILKNGIVLFGQEELTKLMKNALK